MPFISSGLNVCLLLHCVVVYQGTSLPSTPTSDGQPGSRKRRWGSSSSKKKTSLSISTDSLKVKTFYNNKFLCWVGEFFCCFFVFVCLFVWFFFCIQVAGDKKIPCNILKSGFSGTGSSKCRALSCIVATDRPDVVWRLLCCGERNKLFCYGRHFLSHKRIH